MLMRITTLTALGIALVTANSFGQQAGGIADQLQPGDMVRVVLSREVDMSGEFVVDEAGVVALPIIGVRETRNKTPAVLKQELVAAYADQLRNQTIQVTFLRRVRVLGEVRDPGLYHADPTMTLADVVALAGGVTSLGKRENITIVRDGEEFGVDIHGEVFQQVRSGDQILVPEKGWLERNRTLLVTASISVTAIVVGAMTR
jgi:polysaccharide export outer membrane protein